MKTLKSEDQSGQQMLAAMRLGCLIISNPPKQKVVGAVVPPHRFTAVGQPEVLVAVSTRNNKMVGFGRDVGGGSAVRGVPSLQVPVDDATALRLITWSQEKTGFKSQATIPNGTKRKLRLAKFDFQG